MSGNIYISGESSNNKITITGSGEKKDIDLSTKEANNNLATQNNNAKYYSDKALESANKAEQQATLAKSYAESIVETKNELLNNEGFVAVSQNLETINVVAESIENVNYVGENIEEINQLVDDLEALGDTTNIEIVATNIDNINSLAENIQTIEENKNIVLEKAEESKVNANNASQSANSSLASSNNAKIWAEGTDAEVQALGGEHSAKVWAEQGGGSVDLTGYIKNKEIISGAISIGNTTSTVQSTTVGGSAYSAKNGSSFGYSSRAEGQNSVALGYKAQTTGTSSIQIGEGTNTTANSLQVKNYPLMNLSTGKIYADRLEATGANVDLSNLSSEGEKHFLNKSQVANCLLEVPQNIKLELVDGVLTLKAGSKVIVPNGVGVFEEKVTTKDLTYTGGTVQGTEKRLVYVSSSLSSVGAIVTTNVSSGSETPSGTWKIWYDTINNVVNKIEDTVGQVAYTCGFPLGVVTVVDGVITSIDQIFNGFGYIGSTVFVDKGVKGLIPNGFNEDGTLNNIEFTIDNVLTRTMKYSVSDGYLFYNGGNNTIEIGLKAQLFTVYDTLPAPKSDYERCFVEKENQQYFHVAGANTWTKTSSYFIFGDASCSSGGKIDFVKHKQPFRAVDYNDKTLPQVDGQWNSKSLRVAENVSLAITSAETDLEYDLSSYLPNDSYNYEVLLSCNMSTGAKSGAYLNASFVGRGTKNQDEIWSRAMGIVTRTASSMDMFNSVIIPIGLNRKLILRYNVAGASATLQGIWLEGYRRIGTNE